MSLINCGVRQILKQRQQRPQGFKNNKFTRNNDRCYYYGKLGRMKQNYPELRRRSSRKNKNFESWSDEDET